MVKEFINNNHLLFYMLGIIPALISTRLVLKEYADLPIYILLGVASWITVVSFGLCFAIIIPIAIIS